MSIDKKSRQSVTRHLSTHVNSKEIKEYTYIEGICQMEIVTDAGSNNNLRICAWGKEIYWPGPYVDLTFVYLNTRYLLQIQYHIT